MTLLLLVMLRCSALRQTGGLVRQRVRLSSTLPHVADEASLRRRDEPYTRAITRSGRRGEWRRAIALLDALERRHEVVSVRAGTAALVACDRAGCGRGLGGAPRWAEAQEILGRRSFEPDAFTYTTALRCLGRASRPDDVAALFEEAVARGLADDARVRDAAAVALARSGRFAEARAVLTEGTAGLGASGRRRTAWLRRSRRRFDALSVAAFPGDGDDPATRALEVALGDAATWGTMPCFGDEIARKGYARLHLAPRAQKVADAFFCAEDAWLRLAVARIVLYQEDCRVLSLGGGPGGDFAALATLADYAGGDYLDNRPAPTRHQRPSAKVHCDVVDYEEGWAACVEALASVMPGGHRVAFHTGDITVPLDSEANAAIRADTADVIVASYVVAENAVSLRASEYVFFRDLFKAAQPGALFLFAETTHRLWPEILQCALDALEGPVPISLPTNLPGRSGSTIILQKGGGGAPDARALPPDHAYARLIERFVDDNAAHERRLERDRDRGARTSGRSPWRGDSARLAE
jgi:pentatricopeptide repeat protein